MDGRIQAAAHRLRRVDNHAWGQRVGAFTHLPALIRQLGDDPVATLGRAGLGPNALDHPEGRIPYAALGKILADTADRTGCSHIGLLAGRMWSLSDLGLVGDAVLHCATLREALETLTVYQHLNSEGGLAFLLERGGVVDLGYAIYHAGIEGSDHIYDGQLAGGLNFMRELCGPGWLPTEVFIPHKRPGAAAHYRNLFKSTLRFDSEMCALRFPASLMSHRVADDAQLGRATRDRAERASREGANLLQRVYRALRLVLLKGKCSGDDVALALSMHRRTLNRRLQEEGTTFQAVLDEVRFEVARQLLGTSQLAMDDIAAALGYASVSPFMRAFRRWTGNTPGEWRHASQRSQQRVDATLAARGGRGAGRSAAQGDGHRAPGAQHDETESHAARVPEHGSQAA